MVMENTEKLTNEQMIEKSLYFLNNSQKVFIIKSFTI